MSWHSGDWANFSVTLASAIAAVAAAISAVQSSKSAKDSLNQQREAFLFERKRHLHEQLKADAAKANASVKNTAGKDWTFYQSANATYAIDSAKQTIKDASSGLFSHDVDKLKEYFKDQLCFEITSEMKEARNVPDGFLGSEKSFKETREVTRLWLDNLKFFDFIIEVDKK
ncbi:hypothetical protein [uncultured Pantoea sp.]|uniref:hypothetical protein n=1 Tax=uncultured Pantoea sp. TaxID=218084 RepID=UPI0025D7762E|nr:hypothetical protein [uncultured Pantoea sp.]